jgi:hypothetical protein
MSATALVPPASGPVEVLSLRPASPAGGEISLDQAIGRLRGLGVTVRCAPLPHCELAVWCEDTRTVTVRADAALHEVLFVLGDLHGLLAVVGHVSPSEPTRRFRVVR